MMVGHHRRASTSSVETVDETQIQWRQETSVLRSVPKQSDNNTWPIFELRDAVVFGKDGQTIENALYVGSRGPFIVRGTLIIDDPSQKQHLIMKVRHSKPIEIRQSLSYSIGEAEDGQPLIWVSGKGGWYEIVPSPSYLPTYNKMCEAATLYYRIMDIIKNEKPKKQKKGKRADPMIELSRVFHKYAALVGDGSTLDEVIERCMEHAPFLISQFATEDKSEFDWETTLFYKWLAHQHSDLVDKARLQLLNQPELPRSPSLEILSPPPVTQNLPSRIRTGSPVPFVAPKHSSPQIEPKSAAPRQRSTRSQSITHKEGESSHEQVIPEKAVPNTLEALPASINAASNNAASNKVAPPKSTSTSQTPETTFPLTIESHTPFESVLHALEYAYQHIHKSPLGLTVGKTLNKVYFAYKFPNYRSGGPGCHKLPVEEVFHYNAKELLKVIDKEKYSKHEIYSWLQEVSEREFNPIAIKLSDFPYRLVPRGYRPRASKTAPALQSGFAPKGSDDDSLSNASGPSTRAGKLPRGRHSGKKSSLRPKKRLHSELESDSEMGEVVPRRSHYFSDAEDMDVDDIDVQSSEDVYESDPIKIILRADKIPSIVPNGPNETWICEEEDCGYAVRGSDEHQCEERIKQHFLDHERQTNRVNLAVVESRGHMPINHLILKLKGIGEKAQLNEQLSVQDVQLPQRIKRKLVV